MRMRRKQNLDGRIEACGDVLIGWLLDYDKSRHENNIKKTINFYEIFGNNNPVMLEIGCGKGGFINKMGKMFPEVNFIALEKSANVIVSAMEQTRAENINNVRYIIGLAEYLDSITPYNSVERIFLNFSCPFPKKTYANHRLTHKRFLNIYRKILKSDGYIQQKTDNMHFFEYSKQSLLDNNYVIKNITEDLHNSDIKGNIMTEYEKLFSDKGCPIFYLEAYLE